MDNDRIELRDPRLFNASRGLLGHERWERIAGSNAGPATLDGLLTSLAELPDVPGCAADLMRLEWSVLQCRGTAVPVESSALSVNPSLRVLELSWKGLSGLLDSVSRDTVPLPGPEIVLVWKNPREGRVNARPATDEDLLVLKMTVEGIPAETVAGEGGLQIGAVDAALDRAVRSGILIAPPSLLVRDTSVFPAKSEQDELYRVTPSFTLQWHITQVCDLHCKHCYDRSDRSPLTLAEALRVLDDLRAFCRARNVQGAVSFTGGNPLLHPDFPDIYRAAAERGFSAAILGNPAPGERIEELIEVRMPAFFQVSLEGLREHNDSIRGRGHFDSVMIFLDVLKELRVSSMVMLTLTKANQDQVLPLAELLRGKTGVFHFNRLALFGEGARLALPDRERYREFLESYLAAARGNPVMGLKDNLINIIRSERGERLFGGCTGYGCGAAFNFATLLADGEVHACRKLPSVIGNIRERGLAEIYDSAPAKRYRLGPRACDGCAVRAVCGGCLAGALSHKLDIFREKDPFCFKER